MGCLRTISKLLFQKFTYAKQIEVHAVHTALLHVLSSVKLNTTGKPAATFTL